jgi:hypothetical protein
LSNETVTELHYTTMGFRSCTHTIQRLMGTLQVVRLILADIQGHGSTIATQALIKATGEFVERALCATHQIGCDVKFCKRLGPHPP